MFNWEVKFYKEVTVTVNAEDETLALAKALATDIDNIPLEWEVSNPKMMLDFEDHGGYNDRPPNDFEDEFEDLY